MFSLSFEWKMSGDRVQWEQHFRQGRWHCAKSYMKSGYSYCICCEGETQVLWSAMCCFGSSWRRDENVSCCGLRSLRVRVIAERVIANSSLLKLQKGMDGPFGSIKMLQSGGEGKQPGLPRTFFTADFTGPLGKTCWGFLPAAAPVTKSSEIH